MDTQEGTDQPGRSSGSQQGAGRWAKRGAERMGLPAGENGTGDPVSERATAGGADPDISPSLAGGHADATHDTAP